SSFVLCSVNDLETSLQEIRRVMKPSGRFLFLEHGLHLHSPLRQIQQAATPLWAPWTGGCHLDRPILEALPAGGFSIQQVRTVHHGALLPIWRGQAAVSREYQALK
ncbi:MAG: methyltransferase domain-containing protein, partial [Firmicutes bacterium]|nr:methyltransferase domain-containing protein [Bacillota bacterium]